MELSHFFWHVCFACFVYSSLFCHIKFLGMSNLSTTYKDKYKENILGNLISSVQFSHSVMSNSLWPHESQHARPPCPSPSPRVDSNSCPSSRWCHPAILSSVIPLLLLSPIPPSIRVFSNEPTLRMIWPKYWSFSFSISPYNEHPELVSFRMDWLDLLAVILYRVC